jgi:hypothetical protein
MRWVLFSATLPLIAAAFISRRPFAPQPAPHTVFVNQPVTDSAKSKIQVVFALDATGSMSGLIAAAKEKIWSIAGSFSQADPAPDIELGLIFYRDRGDKFVTRLYPLSSRLDDIYEKLMEITAEGGGDGPESVNQGLFEAVTKFNWDADTAVYKTIFLVGDWPPHMDYKDDVPYMESCRLAKIKDIVINTILMGNNSDARRIWNEIANCNMGSYTAVDMRVNDIAVNTPYDSAIAAVSDRLDNMRFYYGTAAEKSVYNQVKVKSANISAKSAVNIKAQRAEYNVSKSGAKAYMGKNELITAYQSKKLMPDTLRKEMLPTEWASLSPAEVKNRLDSLVVLRDSLNRQMTFLAQQRQAWITEDFKKRDTMAVNSSFNAVIYDKIKTQTIRKKIKLTGKAKY